MDCVLAIGKQGREYIKITNSCFGFFLLLVCLLMTKPVECQNTQQAACSSCSLVLSVQHIRLILPSSEAGALLPLLLTTHSLYFLPPQFSQVVTSPHV